MKLAPTKANIIYAERLRGEILNAIARGTFQYPDYFPDSKRALIFGHVRRSGETVGDRLDGFMQDCRAAAERRKMSPSTVDGYRKAIETRIRPEFGRVRVADLSAAHIRQWLSGMGVTAKTAKNYLSILSVVLSDCMNEGLIKSNPCREIDARRLLDKSAKPSEYEVKPLNADEVARVIAHAGKCAALFKFAIATGLRTSELIALEWGDIDEARKVLRVTRAQVVGVVKGTKTKAGARVVDLSKAALEALAMIEGERAGRVFLNHVTGKPYSNARTIHARWSAILRRAGVDHRAQYQTRHTFASALLSSGANIMYVAQQMGHNTVEMVIRNYGRWIPDANSQR